MYNPDMGFLEGLRRKKAEDDEAEKRAMSNTHIEEVCFEMITDSEVTRSCKGAKDKTIKTIKQSEWERTPKILEEALGKAYHSPVIIKFTSTPSRGPGGEG